MASLASQERVKKLGKIDSYIELEFKLLLIQ